ncbi:hypothetical protein [Natrialba aegyptia]|nr:hypothetical protein [Natrialba aegyptia]
MPESIAPDEAINLYLKDRKPEVTKSTTEITSTISSASSSGATSTSSTI